MARITPTTAAGPGDSFRVCSAHQIRPTTSRPAQSVLEDRQFRLAQDRVCRVTPVALDRDSICDSNQEPPQLRFPDHALGTSSLAWHDGVGLALAAAGEPSLRITPSRIPLALSVSAATAANSLLAGTQSLFWNRRIEATKLPDDPIFVVGHWRSGTTLLHELLGAGSPPHVSRHLRLPGSQPLSGFPLPGSLVACSC